MSTDEAFEAAAAEIERATRWANERVPVFLSGPSNELDRVKLWAANLESSGIVTLTSRWWESVEATGVGMCGSLSQTEQERRALADLGGLNRCRVAWFLWPERVSHGTAAELGALVDNPRGRISVVSGINAHHCIYTALATHRVLHDEDAFDIVLGRCRVVLGRAGR